MGWSVGHLMNSFHIENGSFGYIFQSQTKRLGVAGQFTLLIENPSA